MDNFYTSVPVAEYFLQHELKSLALDKGAAAFYQHDGLMIAKYRALKDRESGKPKIACVLSTAHIPAMGNTNKRDREGSIVQKPTCIISYNHNMGGVDMIDQQLEGIDVLRKSYKWYKKTFHEVGHAVRFIFTQIIQVEWRKGYLSLLLIACVYTPSLQCPKAGK